MAHNKFSDNHDDDDDKVERICWRTESGRRRLRSYGRWRGRYSFARATLVRVSVVIHNQLLVLPTVFNVHSRSFESYVQGSLPGYLWKLHSVSKKFTLFIFF